MGKKLVYHPKHPDDPDTTSTHGHSFEAGKSVVVPDHVHEALKDNPWFKSGKDADEQAEKMASPSVGDGRPVDSSIDVQYPPGEGMKTHNDSAKLSEGVVAADSDAARNAGNDVVKRGPGRPRHT